LAEFIFMLTKNDATVQDALDVYEQIRRTDLRWIGFKDIGVSVETQKELSRRLHADGRTVVLEIVSTVASAELSSVRTGIEIGADVIMGGTNPDAALPLLAGRAVRYFPFPGRVVDHPSILDGSIEEIAAIGAALTSRPGVAGLDLLAYRHRTADIPSLMRAVVSASSGPVVVAGSIDSLSQIETVANCGAWGFTIGGAVFDRSLVPGASLREQVEAALRTASKTPNTME
jgi:hypothetical protein